MNRLLKSLFSNAFLSGFNFEAKSGKLSLANRVFGLTILKEVWDAAGDTKDMFDVAVKSALVNAKARDRWDKTQAAKLATR
jgi:hypothetical protein